MPLVNALEFVSSSAFVLRYRASEEPQNVHVTAQLGSNNYNHISNVLIPVMLGADYGMVGSDRFAPTAGSAALLENSRQGNTVNGLIRVAGMAPVVMRSLVENLRGMGFDTPLTGLQIIGSLPLDDSQDVTTEVNVRAWLDDPSAYVRQWPKLGFSAAKKSLEGKGVAVRVAFGQALDVERRKEVEVRFLCWRNYVNTYVSPDAKYVPQRLGGTMPKAAWKNDHEVTLRIPEFERTRGPSADALLNLLQRLHEQFAPIAEAELKF